MKKKWVVRITIRDSERAGRQWVHQESFVRIKTAALYLKDKMEELENYHVEGASIAWEDVP